MPESQPLAKAQLRQLDADFKSEINPKKTVTVQFNPETLKVSFANQIAQPGGAGDKSGPTTQQFVGAGSTKLSVQLWFDVSAPLPESEQQNEDGKPVTDVRQLTQKVAYYITPLPNKDNPPKMIPPVVRFLWGSFQFDGIMESMEESLEFFSPEGVPLRANVSLSLTQQKITKFVINPVNSPPGAGGPGGAGRAAPGTQPLTQAAAGVTLQGLAAGLGRGDDWQAIASANGIENPRLLQPGQLINMNVNVSIGKKPLGG